MKTDNSFKGKMLAQRASERANPPELYCCNQLTAYSQMRQSASPNKRQCCSYGALVACTALLS